MQNSTILIKTVLKSKVVDKLLLVHPPGIQVISEQPQTITLRPQLSPYLEGKAAYVIILKPCQLISRASVTCSSQKRGENCLPSHLYSE